jgi:hypothetical protein
MEQSPSWEARSGSATQEIPRVLWNTNTQPPFSNPFFKMHSDTVLPSTPESSSGFIPSYYACYIHFFSVAPQSVKDLGRLTCRRFIELFRHMVGLLGQVISPSQGFYLHGTTQHRKTRTNIHALSGIRTHEPSNQPPKTHASDSMVTVTGVLHTYMT